MATSFLNTIAVCIYSFILFTIPGIFAQRWSEDPPNVRPRKMTEIVLRYITLENPDIPEDINRAAINAFEKMRRSKAYFSAQMKHIGSDDKLSYTKANYKSNKSKQKRQDPKQNYQGYSQLNRLFNQDQRLLHNERFSEMRKPDEPYRESLVYPESEYSNFNLPQHDDFRTRNAGELARRFKEVGYSDFPDLKIYANRFSQDFAHKRWNYVNNLNKNDNVISSNSASGQTNLSKIDKPEYGLEEEVFDKEMPPVTLNNHDVINKHLGDSTTVKNNLKVIADFEYPEEVDHKLNDKDHGIENKSKTLMNKTDTENKIMKENDKENAIEAEVKEIEKTFVFNLLNRTFFQFNPNETIINDIHVTSSSSPPLGMFTAFTSRSKLLSGLLFIILILILVLMILLCICIKNRNIDQSNDMATYKNQTATNFVKSEAKPARMGKKEKLHKAPNTYFCDTSSLTSILSSESTVDVKTPPYPAKNEVLRQRLTGTDEEDIDHMLTGNEFEKSWFQDRGYSYEERKSLVDLPLLTGLDDDKINIYSTVGKKSKPPENPRTSSYVSLTNLLEEESSRLN